MAHRISLVALSLVFLGCAPSHGGKSVPSTPFVSPDTGVSYPSYYQVGAVANLTSALPAPSSGVEATIEVVAQQVNIPLLSFWISETLDNNVWGQVGWTIYGPSFTPQAFFQVYDLNQPNATLDQFAASMLGEGSAPITTGTHTFSMHVQSGTVWSFDVDGVSIGTCDMRSSQAATPNAGIASEENVGSGVAPPARFTGPIHVSGIKTLEAGSWVALDVGSSYGTGWGEKANLLDPGVPPGNLVFDFDFPRLNDGTPLWFGPPPQ
jgi:hypothetical protein